MPTDTAFEDRDAGSVQDSQESIEEQSVEEDLVSVHFSVGTAIEDREVSSVVQDLKQPADELYIEEDNVTEHVSTSEEQPMEEEQPTEEDRVVDMTSEDQSGNVEVVQIRLLK